MLKRYTPLKRSTKPLARTPIRRRSKKLAKDMTVYRQLREEFLTARPLCEVRRPVICRGRSTDVHHRAGRGRNLLATETWIACCRSCHTWVHDHPGQARAAGWLK